MASAVAVSALAAMLAAGVFFGLTSVRQAKPGPEIPAPGPELPEEGPMEEMVHVIESESPKIEVSMEVSAIDGTRMA